MRSSAYAPLIKELTQEEWSPAFPLRTPSARRMALIEIDALVALSLDVTVDELITVYRTQFPVLVGYDRADYLFDSRGRIVPASVRQVWRKSGEPDNPTAIDVGLRTRCHRWSGVDYTYELPLMYLDRVHDLRNAYERFKDHSGSC